MARCPDCNKFVGVEQGDPELELQVEAYEVPSTEPVRVTGTVRLVLLCAECGTELSETNLDIEAEARLEHDEKCEDHDIDVTGENAEATDRYDGKPGTPSRYRRHYYGATVSGTIACTCGAKIDFETSAEEQASGFDSLT